MTFQRTLRKHKQVPTNFEFFFLAPSRFEFRSMIIVLMLSRRVFPSSSSGKRCKTTDMKE